MVGEEEVVVVEVEVEEGLLVGAELVITQVTHAGAIMSHFAFFHFFCCHSLRVSFNLHI